MGELERLDKTGMAFKLKNGTVIWIHNEDIKDISNQIVLNAIVSKEVKFVIKKDTNLTKAQELHNILIQEKGMPAELRTQYYEEILRLYKESGVEYTEDDFFKKEKNKP